MGERISNAGKVLPPVLVVPREQTCEVVFLPVGVMVMDDPVHMGVDVEPTCHRTYRLLPIGELESV